MGSAAVEQDSRAATYLTLVLMKLTLVTLTWAHHGTQASNEFPTINVLRGQRTHTQNACFWRGTYMRYTKMFVFPF